MKLNRQSITEFGPWGKSSRMIWGWLKEGGVFVKVLMEKEAITGVIMAPDGVEYDRKHSQKEGSKKS